MNIQISILVDARHGPPAHPIPTLPGEELLIAGPGQPIPLPADASEAAVFSALTEAARGPLLVWLRAGDQPLPTRTRMMQQAMRALGTPVVAHALVAIGPTNPRPVRLPPKLVPTPTISPDTFAFRRDVLTLARPTQGRAEGTRKKLAVWATRNGGVGWIGQPLLAAADRRLPSDPMAREALLARHVQAAHAVVEVARQPPLLPVALNQLLQCSEQWVAARCALVNAGRVPRWNR